MVGLGGCPVAVTVYPPGRGCLHSASLTKKESRLRLVLLRAATTSARCVVCPTKQHPSTHHEHTVELLYAYIPLLVNFRGAHLLVGGCLVKWLNPPSPSKGKKKHLAPSAEEYVWCVARTPL